VRYLFFFKMARADNSGRYAYLKPTHVPGILDHTLKITNGPFTDRMTMTEMVALAASSEHVSLITYVLEGEMYWNMPDLLLPITTHIPLATCIEIVTDMPIDMMVEMCTTMATVSHVKYLKLSWKLPDGATRTSMRNVGRAIASIRTLIGFDGGIVGPSAVMIYTELPQSRTLQDATLYIAAEDDASPALECALAAAPSMRHLHWWSSGIIEYEPNNAEARRLLTCTEKPQSLTRTLVNLRALGVPASPGTEPRLRMAEGTEGTEGTGGRPIPRIPVWLATSSPLWILMQVVELLRPERTVALINWVRLRQDHAYRVSLGFTTGGRVA
jgi:hypothetical protein